MDETKPGSSSSNGKPALLLPTTTTKTTTVEGADITDPKIMSVLQICITFSLSHFLGHSCAPSSPMHRLTTKQWTRL
jgi:hypothetical protein